MTTQPDRLDYQALITVVPRPGCRFTTLQPGGDPVAVYTEELPEGDVNLDNEEHVSYEPVTPQQIAANLADFTRGQDHPKNHLWMLAGLTAADTLDDEDDDGPQEPRVLCGAIYIDPTNTSNPSPPPCIKALGHQNGPDTDWKRDYHSNGSWSWRDEDSDNTAIHRFLTSPTLLAQRLQQINDTPCPEGCDHIGPHQHLTDDAHLNVLLPDGNVAGCTEHDMGDCPYHTTGSPTQPTAGELAEALAQATTTIGRLLDAHTNNRHAEAHQHAMAITMTLARYTVLATRLTTQHPHIAAQLDHW